MNIIFVATFFQSMTTIGAIINVSEVASLSMRCKGLLNKNNQVQVKGRRKKRNKFHFFFQKAKKDIVT